MAHGRRFSIRDEYEDLLQNFIGRIIAIGSGDTYSGWIAIIGYLRIVSKPIFDVNAWGRVTFIGPSDIDNYAHGHLSREPASEPSLL
jgi:hypothetical protein